MVAVRKHLGREPLQADVWKTHRGHRGALLIQRLAATGMCDRLDQLKILPRLPKTVLVKRPLVLYLFVQSVLLTILDVFARVLREIDSANGTIIRIYGIA